MTYLEALSELQQRGFDVLKVAQATQLSALETTRDCAAALTESSSPALAVPAALTDMTSALAAFGFALLDQQVDYAKQMTHTLTMLSAKTGAELEHMVILPPPEPTLTSAASETPAISGTPEHEIISFSPQPPPSTALSEPVSTVHQPDRAAAFVGEALGPAVAIDNADSWGLVAEQKVAADASLDAAIRAADQDEALAKVLPSPMTSNVSPGPRLRASNSAAKKSKIPSVSGDGPAVKRHSSSK